MPHRHCQQNQKRSDGRPLPQARPEPSAKQRPCDVRGLPCPAIDDPVDKGRRVQSGVDYSENRKVPTIPIERSHRTRYGCHRNMANCVVQERMACGCWRSFDDHFRSTRGLSSLIRPHQHALGQDMVADLVHEGSSVQSRLDNHVCLDGVELEVVVMHAVSGGGIGPR